MNVHDECVLPPTICAEDVATATPSVPLVSLTLDLAALPQADAQLTALLPHLARLDDAQLIRLAADARRLETCAFRLRGACVAELRRRIRTHLSGGRGRRDTSGIGVGAQLVRLAAGIGVSVATLKTDARIHEVFFAPKPEKEINAETRLACEPGLGDEKHSLRETGLEREYYVTALAAPDPVSAIRHAQERCAAAADYTREDFRRDVLALKQKMQPVLATSVKPAPVNSAPVEAVPKSVPNLSVKIIPEAQTVLDELVNRSGQSPETIIAEALLMYHQALTTPVMTETPPTIVAPSPKKERRANSASEAQMQPSLLSPSLFSEH